MDTYFYRYVSAAELASIKRAGIVRSRSDVTRLTPDKGEDPDEVAKELLYSMLHPSSRIGKS